MPGRGVRQPVRGEFLAFLHFVAERIVAAEVDPFRAARRTADEPVGAARGDRHPFGQRHFGVAQLRGRQRRERVRRLRHAQAERIAGWFVRLCRLRFRSHFDRRVELEHVAAGERPSRTGLIDGRRFRVHPATGLLPRVDFELRRLFSRRSGAAHRVGQERRRRDRGFPVRIEIMLGGIPEDGQRHARDFKRAHHARSRDAQRVSRGARHDARLHHDALAGSTNPSSAG